MPKSSGNGHTTAKSITNSATVDAGTGLSSSEKNGSGGNGHATKATPARATAGAIKPASTAKSRLGTATDSTAALLERAGVTMTIDPNASAADRQNQFANFQLDALPATIAVRSPFETEIAISATIAATAWAVLRF